MSGKSKAIWFWVILAVLPGCTNNPWAMPTFPAGPAASPPPPAEGSYLGKSVVKNETSGDNSSAIETALALSDKQAKLSEELLAAQQGKRELEEANHKLAADAAKVQAQLDAAQKELGEANQMLVEMRKEIDAWKSSVLGFRDEMRKAEKAELDGIRKVLVVLGAEAPTAPAATAAPAAAPAAPGAATQPATQPAEAQARAGL